jgi:hypothetical protein
MGVKAFPVRRFREVDRRHYRRIRGNGQHHSAPIRGSSSQAIFSGTGNALPEFCDRKEFAMTAKKKWSAEVTEHSDAMDLEEHIFEADDAKKIAASLKRSAEHSDRRKAEPFQSAMSMLNFYINRAGKNLPQARRKVLEDAKNELRVAFGRPEQE